MKESKGRHSKSSKGKGSSKEQKDEHRDHTEAAKSTVHHSKGTSKETTTPDDVRLPEEYKPLSCYLDDKEKLIDQLFSTIHGAELAEMTPKNLKMYKREELKRLCYDEVKNMSNKMILHILKGKDPSELLECSTVDSTRNLIESEEPNLSESESQANLALKRKYPSEIDAVAGALCDPKRSATVKGIDDGATSVKSDTFSADAFLELYPSSNEMELMDLQNKKESPGNKLSENSDLELLELEMRARAIRSLLKLKSD